MIIHRFARILLFGALAFAALAAPAHSARAAAPDAAPLPGAEIFTNGATLRIAIEVSPESLKSLEDKPRDAVPAVVKEGGRVYQDVGVHLKGAAGSFRSVDGKPGLVVNFSMKIPGQKFHGLQKILLNNSVQDPSFLNEKLAGELFRAAGVPAPRTSHALVELNGRVLGLYVLKEAFSKDYLRIWFGNTEGNLYDINLGFYDLGNGRDLQKRFRLESGKGASPMADLAVLIEACGQKDLAQRWTDMDGILDVDRFISFMAMEVITCHIDGYSLYGHNFRIYHDARTRKLVFIPNDMDRMFQEGRGAVLKPAFRASVATALMQTPQGREKYEARCAWLCTNVFNLDKMTQQVREVSSGVRPVLASWKPEEVQQFDRQTRGVCERLKHRASDIKNELGR